MNNLMRRLTALEGGPCAGEFSGLSDEQLDQQFIVALRGLQPHGLFCDASWTMRLAKANLTAAERREAADLMVRRQAANGEGPD